MSNYTFGEKQKEWSPKQKTEVPVVISPKYYETRKRAVELIERKQYGLVESDFWILMNETKSGKMMYSGLIISHNGCLKINDYLPQELKFRPECVTIDKEGYNGSLVFIYCSPAQGLFETGEVSTGNCKNAYPYAMAQKRCQDRVILKNSKLAYSGFYSESESDEFKKSIEEPKEEPKEEPNDLQIKCQGCGKIVTPQEHDWSIKHFKGAILCRYCQKELGSRIKASKP